MGHYGLGDIAQLIRSTLKKILRASRKFIVLEINTSYEMIEKIAPIEITSLKVSVS